MGISENLFSNLLVVTVLGTLGLMIYCKVTGKTMIELIKDIREALSSPIDE